MYPLSYEALLYGFYRHVGGWLSLRNAALAGNTSVSSVRFEELRVLRVELFWAGVVQARGWL